MPKFPKNTGFKLPGIGSREIDTPGNFRKSQKVEDVGYCLNTESHMLPKGSSPLLATDSDLHDTSWLVPQADKPSYTGSRSTKPWPTKKKEGKEATVGEAFHSPTKPVEVEETETPVEQDRIEIELGTGDYQGGGTFKNQEQRDWYDDQIAQRIKRGMSKEEAIQDYRNTFKIGKQNKDIAIIEGERNKFKRIQ